MKIRSRYHNTCDCCGCALDAGEGRYCDECREELEQEKAEKQLQKTA